MRMVHRARRPRHDHRNHRNRGNDDHGAGHRASAHDERQESTHDGHERETGRQRVRRAHWLLDIETVDEREPAGLGENPPGQDHHTDRHADGRQPPARPSQGVRAPCELDDRHAEEGPDRLTMGGVTGNGAAMDHTGSKGRQRSEDDQMPGGGGVTVITATFVAASIRECAFENQRHSVPICRERDHGNCDRMSYLIEITAKTRNARRAGLAAVIAFGLVLAIVATVVQPDRTDETSAPRAMASVGPDLHSLVAIGDGRVLVGGHDGVVETRDAGRSWNRVPSLDRSDATGWGQQDRTVFVSGHPGLNRSDDSGATFTPLREGLPATDLHGFGAGRAALYAAGPDVGLIASTDDGQSWQQRSRDVGRSLFGRIVVDGNDDAHLIAADQRGAVESRDGGRTWQLLDGTTSATWVSSPDGGGSTLLVSGPSGVVRRTEGGRTWQQLQLPVGALIVEATPGDAQHLYAAGLSGDDDVQLWESRDGGNTWAP